MTPPAHAQWCWAAAPPHSDDARDAQRYRWLRQENGAYGISNSGIYDYFTGERADEVIDAAMGGKAGGD
jgi:hypothetical protein